VLFDLQHIEREGWQVLAVVGELDLAAVPRVRHAVVRVLGPGSRAVESRDIGGPGAGAGADPRPRIVLDLGAVDFIDSSGLGVVIGTKRRVRAAGGELRLVVTEPQVRAVFALTELDQILTLYASLDEAIAPGPPAVAARPDRQVDDGG
jgi:anti-sigma B factor antagonist